MIRFCWLARCISSRQFRTKLFRFRLCSFINHLIRPQLVHDSWINHKLCIVLPNCFDDFPALVHCNCFGWKEFSVCSLNCNVFSRKCIFYATYIKRCKASDWGCDPISDWSLSVESSRNVVTPNGRIGATVARAANGIVCPAAAPGVWPPCDEWLFGSCGNLPVII